MPDLPHKTTIDSPSIQPDVDGQDKEFPRGEILPPESVKLEPIDAVNKFVGHRTASVNETVLSTIAVADAANAFRGDSSKSEQWLGNMVRVKALTKTEASVGLNEQKTSASNLSKYRKIAQYEHVLRAPKIASLLSSGGFATLYECAKLFERLESENPATAIDALHSMLINHDGPASRDWLKKQRDARRSSKPAPEPASSTEAEAAVPAAAITRQDQFLAEATESHEAAEASGELAERADDSENGSSASDKQAAGKASVTAPAETSVEETSEQSAETTDIAKRSAEQAKERHISELSEEDEDRDPIVALVINVVGSTMSADDMIQIENVIEDLSESSIIILYGPLGQLLSSGLLLEQFGVNSCQSIYNVDDDLDLDLTHHLCLAVFNRAYSTAQGRLSDPVTDTDPAVLADHILEDVVGRKVLLFGSTQAEGWESVEASDPPGGGPMRTIEIDASNIHRVRDGQLQS